MQSDDNSKLHAPQPRRRFRAIRYLGVLIALFVLAYTVYCIVMVPSLNLDWSPDQTVLARAEIAGDTARISNIRNITYRSTSDYDLGYYDKTFDLDTVESVWFMVEPFAGYGAAAAHTLVSFGFRDGSYVAISPEIRKEKGEKFSALKGLFQRYELVYVIADEHDVIGLRANYRKDNVYLYPIDMTTGEMRALFVSMLERANSLARQPEFYNTIGNTCTSNMVAHVNEVIPRRIPSWSFKTLLPAYFGEFLHTHSLIKGAPAIEEIHVKYRINDKALQYADAPSFSERIREGI